MEQDNTKYVQDAFNALRDKGIVHTQKDFANLLEVDKTQISKALGGDEKNVTKNLLKKLHLIMEKVDAQVGDSSQDKADVVKIVPTEALAGTLADYADSVQEYECEKMVSPIKGADLAIKIFGDSMSPEYPSGSMLLIKKVNEKAFIEWGKVYVLDTENGAVIKQIRRTDRENVVECVSLNPAFQPFTIDTSYIKGWYRILMLISLK